MDGKAASWTFDTMHELFLIEKVAEGKSFQICKSAFWSSLSVTFVFSSIISEISEHSRRVKSCKLSFAT